MARLLAPASAVALLMLAAASSGLPTTSLAADTLVGPVHPGDQGVNPWEEAAADAVIAQAASDDRVHSLVALYRESAQAYEVHSANGSVVFQRVWNGSGLAFPIVTVVGENPIGLVDADFLRPADGLYRGQGVRYSNPYERLAAYFDSPRSGDLVVDLAPHNGDHIGGADHGSLETLASRGQVLVSGKGFHRLGVVDRSIDGTDVAPTVAALMDVPVVSGRYKGVPAEGVQLRWQDGDVQDWLLTGETPGHVVAFVIDQGFPDLVLAMLAQGQLPNLQALLDRGTSLRYGAVMDYPSNTMPGHALLATGASSGHHGIVDNLYFERSTQQTIDTNSPEFWQVADRELSPEVETLLEAVHRKDPGAYVAVSNDLVVRGSDYSTIQALQGEPIPTEEALRADPQAAALLAVRLLDGRGIPDPNVVAQSRALDDAACIDEGAPRSVEATIDAVGAIVAAAQVPRSSLERQIVGHGVPAYLVYSQAWTDGSAHRWGFGGACTRNAYISADHRIGLVMQAYRNAGVFDDTAFYVVGDHGQSVSTFDASFDEVADPAQLHFTRAGQGLYLHVARVLVSDVPNGLAVAVTADDTGAALRGATVSLGSLTATTDDLGHTTLAGATRQGTLAVDAVGYAPVVVDLTPAAPPPSPTPPGDTTDTAGPTLTATEPSTSGDAEPSSASPSPSGPERGLPGPEAGLVAVALLLAAVTLVRRRP